MISGGRRLKVLVIEDEPLISIEIEDVIDALGHEMIGPIAQLDEAFAVAQRGGFDCAVLDINIIGGNTYAIAEILMERGCPFVIATGYSNWSIPTHLTSYKRLTKPYGSLQLEAELRRLEVEAQLRR